MARINYTKDAVQDSLETITDFIRWGASLFKQSGLFYGHGNASAIDEAAYLVLHTLNLEPDSHSIYFSSKLTENEKSALIGILFRRAKEKIPAAYLTNESWFAGLSFYVDERVLVPRSPLAELIQNHYQPWIGMDSDEEMGEDTDEESGVEPGVEPGVELAVELSLEKVEQILDLCTGCGCIAVANAYYFPHAEVDAVDISEDALDVALLNIEKHGLVDQINIIQSDLFSNLQGKQYDIIVSNPPYVDAEDMAGLPKEYHSEPQIGLAAGHDGLDLVIPMLEQASEHLYPGGILIVEVGNSEYALQERYPELAFNWLEFENGGQGVFLLTKEQLLEYFADE